MTGEADLSAEREGHIVKAAMALAVERGWRALGLGDIAKTAGVSLAEIYRIYPSKDAILVALARQVDAMVLATDSNDPEERARDRLFDVLMRRFDALAPFKQGLAVVWRESRSDPLSGVGALGQLRHSMGWMLEAAGIARPGLAGMAQAHGLAAVWLSVLPVWFADESVDLAKTMAALDSRLRQAEELWLSVTRPFSARGPRHDRATEPSGP